MVWRAKELFNNGYSRKDVASYIVEYARRPAPEANLRWLKGNYHVPKNVPLLAEMSRDVRKFFTDMHLPIIVAGLETTAGVALYTGGGGHGGPITKKINLPQNWDKLVAQYKDIRPSR